MSNLSLSHTNSNCKYRKVFEPKYSKQIIDGQLKVDIGEIIRKLCKYRDNKNN